MCMVEIQCHLTSIFVPYPLKFEFWRSFTHSKLQESIINQLSSFHKFSLPSPFASFVVSKVNPSPFSLILTFLWWFFCKDYIYWIISSCLELGSNSRSDSLLLLILSQFSVLSPSGNFTLTIKKNSISQGEMLSYFPNETFDLPNHEFNWKIEAVIT